MKKGVQMFDFCRSKAGHIAEGGFLFRLVLATSAQGLLVLLMDAPAWAGCLAFYVVFFGRPPFDEDDSEG